MALRLALIYEDNEVFVELKPEVLKELITQLLSDGVPPEEVYDRLVAEVQKLTFRA